MNRIALIATSLVLMLAIWLSVYSLGNSGPVASDPQPPKEIATSGPRFATIKAPALPPPTQQKKAKSPGKFDATASAVQYADQEMALLRNKMSPVLAKWGLNASDTEQVFKLWRIHGIKLLAPKSVPEDFEMDQASRMSREEVEAQLKTILGGEGYYSQFVRYCTLVVQADLKRREPERREADLNFLKSVARDVGAPSWTDLREYEHKVRPIYGAMTDMILKQVEALR